MPTAGPPRAVSSTCVVIMWRAPVSSSSKLAEPQPRDLPLLLGRNPQFLVRVVLQTRLEHLQHLARPTFPSRRQ